MAKDIPGFYFDSEKGKYFKLIADGHASPAQQKHTSSAVKQQKKLQAKDAVKRALETERCNTTVQQSRILLHPHTGVPFLRESAQSRVWGHPGSHDGVQSFWCKSLTLKGSLPTPRVTAFDKGVSTAIALHRRTGAIAVGEASGKIPVFQQMPPKWESNLRWPADGHDSGITGLCFTERDEVVYSSYGGSGHFRITNLDHSGRAPVVRPVEHREITGQEAKDKLAQVFYDVRLSPDPRVTKAAFASARGVQYTEDYGNGYRDPARHLVKLIRTESHMLAVDWLSTNTIAGGCRSGEVRLYDVRGGDSVLRLQHPSSVIGVRNIGTAGHSMLLAGLENHMYTYDLRFAKAPSNGALTTGRINPSRPYMSFHQYTNAAVPKLGFDVCNELGLVAAATDDGRVLMFNIATGKRLAAGWDDGGLGEEGERVWPDYVRCLIFAEKKDEIVPSVLMGVGDKIEKWEV